MVFMNALAFLLCHRFSPETMNIRFLKQLIELFAVNFKGDKSQNFKFFIAKASHRCPENLKNWIPACAGMTYNIVLCFKNPLQLQPQGALSQANA